MSFCLPLNYVIKVIRLYVILSKLLSFCLPLEYVIKAICFMSFWLHKNMSLKKYVFMSFCLNYCILSHSVSPLNMS